MQWLDSTNVLQHELLRIPSPLEHGLLRIFLRFVVFTFENVCLQSCCPAVCYLAVLRAEKRKQNPHKWSQDAWNRCMLVNYLHPHKWSQDAWNRPETDQRSKRDLLTRVQNKTCYTSKRDLYKQKWPTKRAKETYQHGFKTKHAFWGSGLGSPVSGATLLFYRSIFRSHFFFKKKTCILGQRAWQPTS
jgi:hypothetical protein